MLPEIIVRRNLALLGIVILGLVLFFAASQFQAAFFGSIILFTLFKPLQDKFTKSYKLPNGIAALFVIIISFFTVVIPITLMGILLATSTASYINANVQDFQKIPDAISESLINNQKFLNTPIYNDYTIRKAIGEIKIDYSSLAQQLSGFLRNFITGFTTAVSRFLLDLIIMYFVLYYLLRDKDLFGRVLYKISPFNQKNSEKLVKEFQSMTYSSLIGSIAVAITQGASFGLGIFIANTFFHANIPAGVLISFLVGIASFIPLVGAPLIWGPVVILTALFSSVPAAIFLVLWGAILVSNIDNVARTFVNQKVGNVHPLVSIIGLFIGIPLFGVLGIVLGPVLVSFFILFADMFMQEFVTPRKLNPENNESIVQDFVGEPAAITKG